MKCLIMILSGHWWFIATAHIMHELLILSHNIVVVAQKSDLFMCMVIGALYMIFCFILFVLGVLWLSVLILQYVVYVMVSLYIMCRIMKKMRLW